MNRTSLLLIVITLVCGTVLGWSIALMINRFRDMPVDAPIAAAPVTQQIIVNEVNAVGSNMAATIVSQQVQEEIPYLPIAVSINGAVKRPGVYNFAEDARVDNGIRKAGGTTDKADMSDINIAAKLMDNTSLYIPFQMFHQQEKQSLVARRTPSAAESNPARYTRSGWAHLQPASTTIQQNDKNIPVPTATPTVSAPTNRLINLNTATLDELQKLPGIGPKTAEKIDRYRKTQPFQAIEDLEAVNGIGPKTMESVRDFITVN